MVNIRKQKKNVFESIIIYSLLFLVSIWLLQGKNNYHIDEMFSYGLANHKEGIVMPAPEEGRLFEPAKEAYYNYLTVSDRLNFKNVWLNQEIDVHPPLYYSILHTICSFFPGQFSIWFAGSINIVSVMLTLFIIRKIMELLEITAIGRISISFLFVFSTGIWSAICFLRMYALAMFWVTLTAYIFIKTIKNRSINWKTFVIMFGIAICGALTHYYYLVYLFFLCSIYFFYLVFNERKKVVWFLLTFGLAGLAATNIFPPMIFHMFEDYRGEESIENLSLFTIDGFVERFKIFKNLVDRQLFADCFNIIIMVIGIFIIVLNVYIYVNKSKRSKEKWEWIWCVLYIPFIAYFALVTQMAVYTDARYMIPIYAIILVSIFASLFKILEQIPLRNFVIIGVAVFIIISMIIKNECDFRRIPEGTFEIITEYAEKDCIFIHDNNWTIQSSYGEISNYKSVRFFSESYFHNINYKDYDKDELLVSIINDCNTEEVIKKVLELYPCMKEYREIVSYAYSKTYYFSK